MSKHTGRNSRWYEVDNKHYTALCGKVIQTPRGTWDAIVKVFRRFESDNKIRYVEQQEVVGEFRRAREAMMAVEDRAVQINRSKGGTLRVEVDDSLR